MKRLHIARALALLALFSHAVHAQFNITTERVASGFTRPIFVVAPPDDYERVFIGEHRSGKIWILKDGVVLPTPFLDLDDKVIEMFEWGLHGMAFHPDYATNGKFYVSYVDLNEASIIEQYEVSDTDPDLAEPLSAQTVLLPVPQPGGDHNGGCLLFRNDGKLYFSFGDGSCCGDNGPGHLPGGNAQHPDTLLGKILRFDVDLPFPHIPVDNPYVGDPNVLDPIWAWGVRSGWRFSFDRANGDMYLSDVGGGTIEEISWEPGTSTGGTNYGWRCMEGSGCTGISGCTCNAPELTLPVDEYTHASLQGCAVIGGYVYRGCAIPSLQGQYLYGDFCTARVWTFNYDGVTKSPTVEITAELDPGPGMSIGRISSFGEDAFGELYICDMQDGEVYKILPTDPIVDCNSNGVADACDILAGTSCDNDGNGVPDECEGGSTATTYCTSKSGLFCGTAAIGFTGAPSANATSGFDVFAGPARGIRGGFLLYSLAGRAALPFQGGLLCVDPAPLRRSVGRSSGGTLGQCDGQFSLDMNAFAHGLLGGSPDPGLLEIGNQVNGQWWGRDTVANGAFLSDAIEYPICP